MMIKYAIAVAFLNIVLMEIHAQSCQEPPADVSVRKCCKIPKLVGENTAFQCRSLTNGGQKTAKVSAATQPDSCLVECLFNTIGVLHNGTVSRTELLAKYSSNAGGDQELITAIEAGINVCIGNDGLATQQAKPPKMDKQVCESNSALVFSCVYREILLKCPVKLLTDSEPCKHFKVFVADCPPPPFS